MCCFLKISSSLKMKARHMYEMNYESILLTWATTITKMLQVKNKATPQINSCDAKIHIFSRLLGGTGWKKNKRTQVLYRSKMGKNLTKNFLNSHARLLVWKIAFSSELHIFSSNFLCKNFFQLQFLVEMQTKRVPPNPVLDWGGTHRKLSLRTTCLETQIHLKKQD